MISWMVSSDVLVFRVWNRATANWVWRPSSREMSSLEKVSPGRSARFLSQKIEQKAPEKKMPSTQAKATKRVANDLSEPIQFRAHSAFFSMHGMVVIALNSLSFSSSSLTYVSMSRE